MRLIFGLPWQEALRNEEIVVSTTTRYNSETGKPFEHKVFQYNYYLGDTFVFSQTSCLHYTSHQDYLDLKKVAPDLTLEYGHIYYDDEYIYDGSELNLGDLKRKLRIAKELFKKYGIKSEPKVVVVKDEY